jgi:hypothetical protein
MKLPELKELPTQELVARLTAERDSALNELSTLIANLAVSNYEEALQEIDSLRIGVQRGIEAASQVELLRESVKNDCDDDLILKVVDVVNSKPCQCLAEIKAQAGRDGFVAGALAMGAHGMAAIVEEEADGYANQLRQAKGGE